MISIWKFIDYYPSTTVPLVEGACPTPMGDCKYLGFFAIVNNLVLFVPTCVVRENRQLQVSSLSNRRPYDDGVGQSSEVREKGCWSNFGS